MLRLRAFRPTAEKVVRLQLHPTHPWLVTADANDNVVVWDWEHRQVVYEFNAGRVDEKRLVGARLQKLAEGDSESKAKPTEAIRGGSVKQIKFYDDDVRFWQAWLNRVAAAEAPVAVNQQFSSIGGGHPAIRGKHFLVICCENKAILLDLVTMRGRDVPKQLLENKAPLCVEFLPRSGDGDGPFAAFGGSDGIIRVLSMNNWQIIQRYIGGHKGAVSCLITFVASSGETLLVSGSNDGFVVVWNGESPQASREVSPKLSIKAHDGGVSDIQMARVQGGAPQLITIGVDKTLAVWDTVSFKELRRVKPVSKVACQSVASWCHPRAPNLDILICVKDSHIWAIEHATYSAMTRDLCDLSSQVPTVLLTPNKKLKAYCMAVHPLQPHLVATGTNLGVILSEFDAKSIPAAVALPSPSGSKEHDVVFMAEREVRLLTFQISGPTDLSAGASSGSEAGRSRSDSIESAQLHVKQTRRRVVSAPYDSYSLLSVSSSGKYVSVLWPDAFYFSVFRVSDWSMVDSGPTKYFAWDSCKERYALLETVPAPKILPVVKSGSSRKAREAAAQAAAVAAAAAANAAASATVEIRILLEDGSSNLLTKSIEGRTEQVIGLQGGALLGVAYKMPRGSSSSSTFSMDDGSSFLGSKSAGDAQANFQIYSWESFKPVSGMLPQPEWSAWDQTVEYCAFAYQRYIVIASLRPQYRYLGNVAIGYATGGVWHRRQLFLATPTSIECVFVDAGVSPIDVERKKRKEEEKVNQVQAKAIAEQGELALLTVNAPHAINEERVALRPPMLQVVRLASFQTTPSVPLFLPTRQSKADGDNGGPQKDVMERKVNDNAVAGGGVQVAVSRLPLEQKRPVGPLLVVGVRDGVLWLVDRYMTAHAIGLSHPGIRCRCLAAYGDAVSAVKWASRLGREHHDDLAQFMLGMGYATEALHLPGISKRLEYELAMQSGDLKRAFQCLTTLSNSKSIGQEIDLTSDVTGILALTTKEKKLDAVQGIANFSAEFIKLVDAADATGQTEIAGEALKKLAAAGAVVGALQPRELKGLALRLATHGELTRLAVQVNTMISAGHGREAALAAALLGDPSLLEKAWQDTNMFPEAALHAHAHGRPTLKALLEQWNSTLQKDYGIKSKKLSTSSPESSILSPQRSSIMQNLSEPVKRAVIEVVPPGLIKASSTTPLISTPVNQKVAGKQEPSQSSQLLLIEAAPLVSV